MKAHWYLIGVLAASTAVVGCTHNKSGEDEDKDEVRMTLDQVPPAAREGLQREAGGATISKVDQETKNGKTVYETDVNSGGKRWEIKVDQNGNLISKKPENEKDED